MNFLWFSLELSWGDTTCEWISHDDYMEHLSANTKSLQEKLRNNLT